MVRVGWTVVGRAPDGGHITPVFYTMQTLQFIALGNFGKALKWLIRSARKWPCRGVDLGYTGVIVRALWPHRENRVFRPGVQSTKHVGPITG